MRDTDTKHERAERIAAIRSECRMLEHRLGMLNQERRALEMVAALERFTCHCVQLNSKMGIHDMHEQTRRGRCALQMGLVSDSLSAWRSCPDCGGTGVAP